MTRAPIPTALRSIRGGVTARDPVTVAAPKNLSRVAAAIFNELAVGVFRTTALDPGTVALLADYCSVMAADWATTRRAPELGRVLGASLKLAPDSQRRLARLAMSKNEKQSDTASHWRK